MLFSPDHSLTLPPTPNPPPNPDPDPVPDPTPNPKPNLDPHPHPHQVKMLFSATLTRNPSKLAPLQLYASQAFEPRTSRQTVAQAALCYSDA